MSTIEMLATKTKAECADSIDISYQNQRLINDVLGMIEGGLEDPNHIKDLCGIVRNAVDRYTKEIELLNSLLVHQSDLLITLDSKIN